MAAGLATVQKIQAVNFYPPLFDRTTRLVEGLRQAAIEAGIPFTTNHVGTMWGGFFTDVSKVSNFEQVMACDIPRFNRFFHGMLQAGVNLAPASYEAAFMSAAHTEEDIEFTVAAARGVFKTL